MCCHCCFFFFFKQKTAYEMRISDWSSDVCSSDLIATVALAAKFHAFLPVLAGTTLGMMLANVPAVYFGSKLAGHMPVTLVHRIAAVIFALLGIATLLGAGAKFGF